MKKCNNSKVSQFQDKKTRGLFEKNGLFEQNPQVKKIPRFNIFTLCSKDDLYNRIRFHKHIFPSCTQVYLVLTNELKIPNYSFHLSPIVKQGECNYAELINRLQFIYNIAPSTCQRINQLSYFCELSKNVKICRR